MAEGAGGGSLLVFSVQFSGKAGGMNRGGAEIAEGRGARTSNIKVESGAPLAPWGLRPTPDGEP